MPPSAAAAGLLFGVEPTDRALAGWQPPVWLELGGNAVYRKEWAELGRWAPCRWTIRWYDGVTGTAPAGPDAM